MVMPRGAEKLADVPVPFEEPEDPVPARLVTTVERLSSAPCNDPPICSMTINELNVSLLLTFPAASVTVIVQSEQVPVLKETKVIVLFPLLAEVVLEEHEPP